MKCALVTGGSTGIGRAICIELAKMGYHILINYRSKTEEAQKTLDVITDNKGSGELFQFDVSNSKIVETKMTEWIDNNKDKHIEVLVNNAGITRDNLMIWMSEQEWQDVINTNLNSLFYVTRPVLKNMIVNKFGRIINVVSLSGQKGLPGQTNYSAAKAGVIGVTKSLAQEVGKKNITVNAVAPGFIHSEMTEKINEKDFKHLIPLKRFGTPDEVAGVVAFLASEKSSYITGETISINGGLY